MIISDIKSIQEDNKEVYICPVKGRTVISVNNTCQEACKEQDCPVRDYIEMGRQA